MNQAHSIGLMQTNKEDRKLNLGNGTKKNSIQVKVKQHMNKRSRGLTGSADRKDKLDVNGK